MNKSIRKGLCANISEYIFAVMPMIVLGIILITKKTPLEIYFTKDWSFISMLLLGQVISKFNTKMIPFGSKVTIESVTLTNAVLICLIFIPAVIVFCGLSMLTPIPGWLYHVQAILFFLSSVLFIGLTILPEIISEA